MHHIGLYLAFIGVYTVGYLRGAYVRERCLAGDCPYFWCPNHKR